MTVWNVTVLAPSATGPKKRRALRPAFRRDVGNSTAAATEAQRVTEDHVALFAGLLVDFQILLVGGVVHVDCQRVVETTRGPEGVARAEVPDAEGRDAQAPLIRGA